MLDFLKPKPKKILVILGHPDSESYCGSLAEAYAMGAREAGAQVQMLRLGDLEFDPILHKGYSEIQPLEPDLVLAQEQIAWAEHLVFVYPNWWSTMPALLKGFIDRAFLPGFAFKYRDGGVLHDKFLSGKTARLIVTLDAPAAFYRLRYGAPGHSAMKDATLNFVGIKPVEITEVDLMRFTNEATRTERLNEVLKLGRNRA